MNVKGWVTSKLLQFFAYLKKNSEKIYVKLQSLFYHFRPGNFFSFDGIFIKQF